MVNDDKWNGVASGDGPDEELEALFAQARRETPGDDLVARVLADAAKVQAEAAATPLRQPTAAAGRPPAPPAWIAALGGWGGLGGVTAAGLMGFALGFWSPDMVDLVSGGQLGAVSGVSVSPDLVELALEIGDV